MDAFGKFLGIDMPIIAEIGFDREGDIDTIINLIRLARKAGANAAKLQTYTPDRYACVSDHTRSERLTQFARKLWPNSRVGADRALQKDDLMFARPAKEIPRSRRVEEFHGKSLSVHPQLGNLSPTARLPQLNHPVQ